MKSLLELLGEKREWRIVLTDSGLGGLSICAGLDALIRMRRYRRKVELVYVDAWPEAGVGYNDLPDDASRAAVFDRALAAMMGYRPDLVIIACNTLSVLYGLTEFAKNPVVPVAGIVDAGVDLFAGMLQNDAAASLILFGTRTTIASGEHVRRLTGLGIEPGRIRTAACHGLAAVIDRDPDDPALPGLVDDCVSRALAAGKPPGKLYAGLACTHYAYVADLFRRSFAGGRAVVLDPNSQMIMALAAGKDRGLADAPGPASPAVEVVSKVELPEAQRRAVARRLETVSPATARALMDYTHVPELF
jgi:glutamate racemase